MAVEHMHVRRIVHRDLKPSNIMLFLELNTWKIIDMGSYAIAGTRAPTSYTLEYCSPEVAAAVMAGDETVVANPASDMWALGVIAFQLATGVMPCSWG